MGNLGTHKELWKEALDIDDIQYIHKTDQGKPRLALVPPIAIEAIGKVMTQALGKYKEGSWKQVEPYRFKDAMMRHLTEYLKDPYSIDYESGLPNLWHLITNAAFLLELEGRK